MPPELTDHVTTPAGRTGLLLPAPSLSSSSPFFDLHSAGTTFYPFNNLVLLFLVLKLPVLLTKQMLPKQAAAARSLEPDPVTRDRCPGTGSARLSLAREEGARSAVVLTAAARKAGSASRVPAPLVQGLHGGIEHGSRGLTSEL